MKEEKIILNIVEKQVISKMFSVGGYYFNNSLDFINAYESLSYLEEISEVYISNIINITTAISSGTLLNISNYLIIPICLFIKNLFNINYFI